MKYIVIEKWQYKNCKPTYYLRETCESLKIAKEKKQAYEVLENDEDHTFYIVPFDETVLELNKEIA